MKKNIVTIALSVITLAAAFSAQAATPSVYGHNAPMTFLRNEQTLISFELTNTNTSNSRVEIRNENGRLVANRFMYAGFINIPTANLQPGKYNYSVINGLQSSQGSFNIR